MPGASSFLLGSAAVAFAAAAPLHAYLTIQRLFPVFGEKGNSQAAFILKVIALKLSGTFVLNSLLLWRWAREGVHGSLDRAVMICLVGMNVAGGLAFVKKGFVRIPPVPLLLGTSAMIIVSQVL